MQETERAIMRTLCYSDIFEFPLTQNEIIERMNTVKKTSRKVTNFYLAKLHHDGRIRKTGSYYHLPKRSCVVVKRAEKTKISEHKKEYALTMARKIIKLPYVYAVFVTGTVAVDNAGRDDDIDLMIISAPGKLWSCRLFVNLSLDRWGVRRHPRENNTANKMCPNLFLDANTLKVPQALQNLYTAYEVIQAKPLSDPYNLHEHFLSDNAWIGKYLPNFPLPKDHQKQKRADKKGDVVEAVLRLLQFLYMKRKRTRETVTPQTAYFHPRDTAGIVLAEYENNCRHYISS